MQEREISDIQSKNTELNSINSDLQKQLDNISEVRAVLSTITAVCCVCQLHFVMCFASVSIFVFFLYP